MERTCSGVECMGGCCLGRKIEQRKKYKNKVQRSLRWPTYNILHATTNQKHAGVTEGGWDRTRNWAKMVGERDFIVLGLLSAPKHEPSKYANEGDIANDNVEYAVGNDGNDKPLAKADDDNNAPIAAAANDKPLADNVDNKYTKGNEDDMYAKGDDEDKYARGNDKDEYAEGSNDDKYAKGANDNKHLDNNYGNK
jgi:hypothetical protein